MTTILFSNSLYLNNSNILSYSFDNSNWIIVSSFPVTLTYTGLTTGNIYLETDLTFTSNNYFIIGSTNITFNGQNKTVNINGVTNFSGLFQNGTGLLETSYTTGYSNILIKDMSMECSTSTVSTYNGWFAQTYFSNGAINNVLNNLTSNGNMMDERTAGICGSWSGANLGSLTVSNCNSSGLIGNFECGGICGARMGDMSGNVIITDCYSTGNISHPIAIGAGGICGNGIGYRSGNGNIQNCYSTGNIDMKSSGGICGDYIGAFNGTVNISNCYSTGEITGEFAGGICGFYAGTDNGNIYIDKCYSTGAITGLNAGGICGSVAGSNGGSIYIDKCYSLGDVSGDYAGGICGSEAGVSNGSTHIDKCYSLGNISGNYAGGIAGTWFCESTNQLCSITNSYSRGNINGLNAGGICGAGIGNVNNPIYSPHVLIANCYSYGNVSPDCGSICGGYSGGSYLTNLVYVDISNCYTVNGPFISPTIDTGINFTYENSSVGSGVWNDLFASTYLSEAPKYSPEGVLLSQGSIWYDPSPSSSIVPFILNDSFVPIITYIDPSSTTINTTTQVTINGTNLNYNTVVNFNSINSVIISITDTKIICIAPNSNNAAQVELKVITDYGTATTYFTYIDNNIPTPNNVSPIDHQYVSLTPTYGLGSYGRTYSSMVISSSRGKKGSQSRIFSYMNRRGQGDAYKNYLIDAMGVKKLPKVNPWTYI